MASTTTEPESNIINIVSKLRTNNIIYRFEKEIEHKKRTSSDFKTAEEILKHFIPTKTEKKPEPAALGTANLDSFFSKIDTKIYTKPWGKLINMYKTAKIIEYLKEKYPEAENLESIILKIDKYIEKYELYKLVAYEQEKATITEIKKISYDEKKKKIKFGS